MPRTLLLSDATKARVRAIMFTDGHPIDPDAPFTMPDDILARMEEYRRPNEGDDDLVNRLCDIYVNDRIITLARGRDADP